ncbi:MAG: hypothetical protein IJU52_02850 [Clostridia bacterium]|nr:hypothetical protein [Clostridia bacterium]
MAASDRFTANTTCYICFTVALAEGYVFDFDEGAVVYINGAETLVDSGYTQILTDNTLQCYTVDLIPEAAAGDVLIEEVKVNGFTLPQPGDTVSANLALLSLPEGANYYIYGWGWFDEDAKKTMSESDVFNADQTYSFGVRLKANAGYALTDDTDPFVNGGTDFVDYNYCCYYNSSGIYQIRTVAV